MPFLPVQEFIHSYTWFCLHARSSYSLPSFRPSCGLRFDFVIESCAGFCPFCLRVFLLAAAAERVSDSLLCTFFVLECVWIFFCAMLRVVFTASFIFVRSCAFCMLACLDALIMQCYECNKRDEWKKVYFWGENLLKSLKKEKKTLEQHSKKMFKHFKNWN